MKKKSIAPTADERSSSSAGRRFRNNKRNEGSPKLGGKKS
jgi:hypothetical protein